MDFYSVVLDWFSQSSFSWTSSFNTAVQLVDTNARPMLLGVTGAILGIYAYKLTTWLDGRRKGRGMDQRRKKFLQTFLADVITDGLENAEYKGQISRKEVKYLYHLCSNLFQDRDFLPRMPKKIWQRLLKKAIRKRLGDKIMATIPDETGTHWKGNYEKPKSLDEIFVQHQQQQAA
jgi:hypothetical protein